MGSSSPSVLVLDDDSGVRESMSRLLRAYGYSPHTAANLAEATQVLSREPMDALIIDVRLSDGDTGLTLLNIVRADPKFAAMPVLVLTGALLSEAEEALITRLRAYLFRKPEGFHAVLKFLDTLTGREQQH